MTDQNVKLVSPNFCDPLKYSPGTDKLLFLNSFFFFLGGGGIAPFDEQLTDICIFD